MWNWFIPLQYAKNQWQYKNQGLLNWARISYQHMPLRSTNFLQHIERIKAVNKQCSIVVIIKGDAKYKQIYIYTPFFTYLEIYFINSFINIIKIFLNGSLENPHVDFYGYIQFLGVFIHNYTRYIDITKKNIH